MDRIEHLPSMRRIRSIFTRYGAKYYDFYSAPVSMSASICDSQFSASTIISIDDHEEQTNHKENREKYRGEEARGKLDEKTPRQAIRIF